MSRSSTRIQAARKLANVSRLNPTLVRRAIGALVKGDGGTLESGAALTIVLLAAAQPPEIEEEQIVENLLTDTVHSSPIKTLRRLARGKVSGT